MTSVANGIIPLRKQAIKILLDSCERNRYVGSRDYTVIQVVINTGISLADLAKLRINDLSDDDIRLQNRAVRVPLLGKTIRRILSLYLRIRRSLEADHDFLFLNSQTLEPLGSREIGHYIAARFRRCGIEAPRPYDALRLCFAQKWMDLGGTTEDLAPLFRDANGKNRLLGALTSGRRGRTRREIRTDAMKRRVELKHKVVQWYHREGLSFRRIYQLHGVAERTIRDCLKMAGKRPRTASEAARLRYARRTGSSSAGR